MKGLFTDPQPVPGKGTPLLPHHQIYLSTPLRPTMWKTFIVSMSNSRIFVLTTKRYTMVQPTIHSEHLLCLSQDSIDKGGLQQCKKSISSFYSDYPRKGWFEYHPSDIDIVTNPTIREKLLTGKYVKVIHAIIYEND